MQALLNHGFRQASRCLSGGKGSPAWMAKPKKSASEPPLGYEAQLWQMADALLNNMDAAEYKHVVLGLLFLKYTSAPFDRNRSSLL